MAAHQPVGNSTSFATGTTSAQSIQFDQKSDTLRVVALSQGAHVGYGSTPVSTEANYYVPAGGTALINIGQPSSQRVVNVIKSPAASGVTTIFFPQGVIGAPFEVGDTVSLSSNLSGWSFEHHPIQSINYPSFSSSTGDNAQSVNVVVDFSSHGFSGTWADSDSGAGNDGTLRKSFKVSARTDSSTGTLYAQQVQVSGDA